MVETLRIRRSPLILASTKALIGSLFNSPIDVDVTPSSLSPLLIPLKAVLHKFHMLKLRVAPSETVMIDVLWEDDNDELRMSPGTPVFTSPECCLGLTYRGRAAEMWALGVIYIAWSWVNTHFWGTLHKTLMTSLVRGGNVATTS